jgi:ketosteroid isomerase-like protein
MSGADVVTAFNDAITAADLDRLVALMAPDHRFVDSAKAVVAGRDACAEAWRSFFAAFPGYRNELDAVREVEPGVVEARGRSVCPGVPALHGPALWRVLVDDDGLVTEWRVE